MPTPISQLPARATPRNLSRIDGARGRIYDSTGRVNAGGTLPAVYLRDYDSNTGYVTIRVDHAVLPEIWMEIPLSLKQLRDWVREQERDEEVDEDEE